MGQVSISAEICAYTEQRSRETLDAVASVRQQNRAVIHHLVPLNQCRLTHFTSRCYRGVIIDPVQPCAGTCRKQFVLRLS
jgi:hypothetical protein